MISIAAHILLLPLKVLIQAVGLLAYRPGWRVDLGRFVPGNAAARVAKARDLLRANTHRLPERDDWLKYGGLLAAAEPWAWSLLRRHVQPPHLVRDADRPERGSPVSMASQAGLWWAAWHRRHDLAEADKGALAAVVRAALANGWRWTHPEGTYDNRAALLDWWHVGPNLLMTAACLGTAAAVTGDRRIRRAYRLALALWLPLAWCPDIQIRLGRYFYGSFWPPHTAAVLAALGYLATGNRLFLWNLRILHRRHGWYNPEVAALWHYARGATWREVPDRDRRLIREHLADYRIETKSGGPLPDPAEPWEVVNLRQLARRAKAAWRARSLAPLRRPLGTEVWDRSVLPPRMRRQQYLWEKNPCKPAASAQAVDLIDLVHLAWLVERIGGEV